MAESPLFAPLTAPVVRPLRWIGLALAALIAAIGAGFGFAQSAPTQYVIFTTAATFTLALWLWNGFSFAGCRIGAAQPRRAWSGPASDVGARGAARFRFRQQGRSGRSRDPYHCLHDLSLTMTGFLTW